MGNDAAAAQRAGAMPGAGDQGHDLVAVDDAPGLVHHADPVAVAVQRNADMGVVGNDRRGQGFGRRGAAVPVDVETVGRNGDRHDLGAEFEQHGRGNPVGSAVRAIDRNLEAVEAQFGREGGLGKFHIAPRRVVEPLGAAKVARTGQRLVRRTGFHPPFDLHLDFVGQLVAVRPEQLDAVVLKRVVRG